MIPPLLILGGGGHAKVVADILRLCELEVLGFLDPDIAPGTELFSLSVLGGDDWLDGRKARVALGLGDNALRERVAARAARAGASFVCAIHPRAVIASTARIGDGAVIGALAVVGPDAVVGEGAIVNNAAVVEHDCWVGPYVHIASNATMGGGCRIERGALLGSGATMLPGTRIGERAVVGSQAVVTRDIAPHAIARGVPARSGSKG